MEKPSISFFAMIFVLLFTVIGFILVIFDLRGLALVFEIGILLAFMFFLAFAMFFVYYNKRSSWGIIAAVLVLLLFDVVAMVILTRRFGVSYMLTTFFAIIGLVIVMVNVIMPREEKTSASSSGAPEYYFPYFSRQPAAEVKREEYKIEEYKPHVEKVFTPGKYIASRKASKFHSAKCDWAARISRDNQLWFDSKEEANGKGFVADVCVA